MQSHVSPNDRIPRRVQLPPQVRDVGPHRMDRDLQLRGNVLVLPTQRHEPQNFQLAWRQRLHVRLGLNLGQHWRIVPIVVFDDDQITHRRRSVSHPFAKQVDDHGTDFLQPRDHHGPDVQPLNLAPRGAHRQFDGRRHQTGPSRPDRPTSRWLRAGRAHGNHRRGGRRRQTPPGTPACGNRRRCVRTGTVRASADQHPVT